MTGERNRNAFTLIEVLIVVVIMAVLAATIIPQFSASTEDAKDSALRFNLHTMRSQIELYKLHHLGNYPAVTANDLPQLAGSSDASGAIGSGAAFPYGPYVEGDIPANPFDNSSSVASVVLSGAKPISDTGDGGWQYDPATGDIWPNNASFDFMSL